ncbi:MAG TPA: 50S ribosomal protein L20, partial [Clostridia bacterium]|nr:50S ribosomal protein L20 [Clostridia bacterium]
SISPSPASARAGARLCGTTYSRMINGLKLAGVDVNRKVLADLAVSDMNAFGELVKVADKARA